MTKWTPEHIAYVKKWRDVDDVREGLDELARVQAGFDLATKNLGEARDELGALRAILESLGDYDHGELPDIDELEAMVEDGWPDPGWDGSELCAIRGCYVRPSPNEGFDGPTGVVYCQEHGESERVGLVEKYKWTREIAHRVVRPRGES